MVSNISMPSITSTLRPTQPTFTGVVSLYHYPKAWWVDAVRMFDVLCPNVLEGGVPNIENIFASHRRDEVSQEDILKASIILKYWEANPMQANMFIDADPNPHHTVSVLAPQPLNRF